MANITQYSNDIKNEAAIMYAVKGSYAQVARTMNIPEDTVYGWSRNYDQWDDLIKNVQDEKTQEHRAKYVQIIDKAQDITLAKLGEATAAQANIIAATATDKVRVIDGMPTSIKSDGGTQALLKQFIDLADSYRLRNTNVIANETHSQVVGGGKNEGPDNSDNPV